MGSIIILCILFKEAYYRNRTKESVYIDVRKTNKSDYF